MYFNSKLVKSSSAAAKHFGLMSESRRFAEHREKTFLTNKGSDQFIVPKQIYAELDNQTRSVLLEPTEDVIYRDLLPLAKSVDFGAMGYQSRRVSEAGSVTVSMGGTDALTQDKVDYNHETTPVPLFQGAIYRHARELASFRMSGFDPLLDDQEAEVRAIRRKMAEYFLVGNEAAVYGGSVGYGILNSPSVAEYTTKVKFDDVNTSGNDKRNELNAIIHKKRIDSRIIQPFTVYVSLEIDATLEAKFDAKVANSKTVRQELLELPGVAEIKATSKLEGNSIILGILSSEHIRPLVGQELSTVALPRNHALERFTLASWAAVGLQIRTDYYGRGGWARIVSA